MKGTRKVLKRISQVLGVGKGEGEPREDICSQAISRLKFTKPSGKKKRDGKDTEGKRLERQI